MLRALAKKMYERGVTNEELLLQKFTAFKPDPNEKKQKRLNMLD